MALTALRSSALRSEESPAYWAWPAVTSIRPVTPDMVGCGFGVFGTFGALLVTQQSSMAAARRILAAELGAIDRACSRFRADSELTALNRAGGAERAISPLFAEALAVALRAADASDGDVDPTCGQSLISLGYDRDFAELASRAHAPLPAPAPAAGWRCVQLDQGSGTVRVPAGVQLDLGATAKALAADRAAQAIAVATGAGVLVNLGGDIAVAGPPPERGWRVQIADDLPPAPASAARAVRRRGPVVAIWDGGLATSGTASRRWRRGGQDLHHIVQPGTGRPATSCWVSVSVAAANCVGANTASTAAVIRSAAAVGWLEGLATPARLVLANGTVLRTGGWPDEP
jgi:FAD:protein FMN transferase